MRRTLALLALTVPAAFCFAEPMSEADFDAQLASHAQTMEEIIAAYQEDGDYDKAVAAVQASVNKILGAMDIASLTSEQLADMAEAQGFLEYASGEAVQALRERVTSMIESAEGMDQLMAMAMALTTQLGEPDEAWNAMLGKIRSEFQSHPQLKELMAGENAGLAISAFLGGEMDDPGASVVKLLDMIGDEPDPAAAMSAMQIWSTVDQMGEALDPEIRERARVMAADWIASGVEYQKAEGAEQRMIDWMEGQIAMLNSPATTGKLIGYEAPDMDFFWSTEEGLTSLDDLKGKVVVVDFWATWCGPCVASFPNVRALRERYPDEHVAIIGVSSIQGAVFGMPGGERQIDCEGDPEKELRLMGEYAEKMDINWTLVMSEQEVFNPDFGVRGIPHVAILDAEGKVRFNGLHPMDEGKTKKIDDLLKEAGLPVPEGES